MKPRQVASLTVESSEPTRKFVKRVNKPLTGNVRRDIDRLLREMRGRLALDIAYT